MCPRTAEECAALIGRIVAPEQFAAHFGIQSDQERFDEFRVGLQQRDGVRRHLLQTGKEKILREIAQSFIHRLRELGRVQNRLERIARISSGPAMIERSLHPRVDGLFGIDALQQRLLASPDMLIGPNSDKAEEEMAACAR